jgi:flagellar protein FliO/FliZ
VLRKRGLVVGNGARARSRGGWEIDILARKGLGRTAQLAVVRAGGRTLVLGVTEQHVTTLAEADPDAVAAIDAANDPDLDAGAQWTGLQGTGGPGSGPTWKTMLDVVRDRTVRR